MFPSHPNLPSIVGRNCTLPSYFLQNLAIFILLLVNPSCAVPQKQQEEDLFALTVLHVNDIHVRMEETNKWSVNCKEEDKGKCEKKKKLEITFIVMKEKKCLHFL